MKFPRRPARQVSVPIIPLIDILVTLLFFFIVSMAPKQRRPVLEVELPGAQELPTRQVSEVLSVLSVSRTGALELDGLHVPPTLLREYLVANRQQGQSEKLEVRMDKGVTLERLLEVQNAVRAAGYEKGQIFHRVQKAGSEVEGS